VHEAKGRHTKFGRQGQQGQGCVGTLTLAITRGEEITHPRSIFQLREREGKKVVSVHSFCGSGGRLACPGRSPSETGGSVR